MNESTTSSPSPALGRVAGVVAIVVAAVAALPLLKAWLVASPPSFSGRPALDAEIAYQLVSALLTVAVVALVRTLGAPGRFLRLGELRAPARALPVLGVKEGERWSAVAGSFGLIATSVTAIVVYLQVAKGHPGLAQALPFAVLLALPFAAVNAAVEEGLVRLTVVEGTSDVLGPQRTALLSGAIFGGIHYFGVPGSVPGVLMAGFLGFVLARSVLETRGVFWAWFLHFLQDVVIFALLFASSRILS